MPQGVQVRPLLPAPRQKNSAPFRFRGLRKSIATRGKRATIKACRENSISAESFFLSETELSRGTSVSVMENDKESPSSGADGSREESAHAERDGSDGA